MISANDSQPEKTTILLRWIAFVAFILPVATLRLYGETAGRYDEKPRIAVSTNLLYDAALTPDIRLELSATPRISFVAEGVWAWWSRHSDNRCWRIYGGWIEARWWLGQRPLERALTGFHIGAYGSYHSYDFEFGHKGWQSPQTLGAGISAGYSMKVNKRINIDFGLRAGYASGERTEYVPQCGTYVSTYRGTNHYFGITGIEISIVWFPGSGNRNNPFF